MPRPPDSQTPAYLSYSTLKNATQSLALDGTMPSHIDHSVLGTMGGSIRKMYLAALRFFELIDAHGVPSERLRKLIVAGESEWKEYFQELLREQYPNLIEHLADATPKSFRDRFQESFNGIGSSLIEPSIRFLVAAARDTGLPVSSHLIQRKPRSPSVPRSGAKKSPKQVSLPVERSTKPQPSFRDVLLDKFPGFDPCWKPEQQAAWFGAFQKLMEMAEKENANGSQPDGA